MVYKIPIKYLLISSSLIQIIKFPDDIMKNCILTINILQLIILFPMINEVASILAQVNITMFCTHKQSPFSLYCFDFMWTDSFLVHFPMCTTGVDLRKKINWPLQNTTGPRNIGPRSGPI